MEFLNKKFCVKRIKEIYEILSLISFNREDYYFSSWNEGVINEDWFHSYFLILNLGLQVRPINVLEIGTRNGLSLVMLLSGYCHFKGVKVVCVDTWEEFSCPSRVIDNLRFMSIPEEIVDFKIGKSRDILPDMSMNGYNDLFDYILVDGSHEANEAYGDLLYAHKFLRSRGYLLFDDIERLELYDIWRKFRVMYKKNYTWFENSYGKGICWAKKLEAK